MGASAGEPRVEADRLAALARAVLVAAGLPGAEAGIVADSLVDADARGIHSHGVSRLRLYVERLRAGGNRSQGEPELILDAPSLALADGRELLSQVASAWAVELAAEKARSTGAAAVCVRGGSHFGAAGYWARLLAERGMVGIASCNTTPVMAAWGGSTTAIGSNPLALAFPSAGDVPVVADMAASETTWGALLQAEATGTPIPESWALGRDGRPTTSASEAVAAGRLLPFGRHKGYAFAVAVELLSGALAGANCLSRVAHLYREPGRPMGAGMFFAAIDPGVLSREHAEAFARQVGEIQRELAALPPNEAAERVMWPGQPEAERAARARERGVALPPAIAKDLRELAAELSLDERLRAALSEFGERAVRG